MTDYNKGISSYYNIYIYVYTCILLYLYARNPLFLFAARRKHFRSEFSTIYTGARMIFTIVAFCSDRRRTPPPPLPPAVNRLALYMYILLYVCMYIYIYIHYVGTSVVYIISTTVVHGA